MPVMRRVSLGRVGVVFTLTAAPLPVKLFSSPDAPQQAVDLILDFARKEMMRAVKRRLDPHNLLGRGVLWQ
jgi:hypothetical protein